MTHPLGKGIFIWQASKYYIPDPKAEAAKLKAAGFKWAAVQTCDGYMTQWLLTIIPLINALVVAGIEVWSWGMIYANGLNAEGWGYSEGVIAGHHRRTLQLAGHIFDPEAYLKRSRGGVGVSFAYVGREEEDISEVFGMTTYRYPTLHRTFPWKEVLEGVSFVCPQVYWERAHNPDQQLSRCILEYRKLTAAPIIPIGAAYGVTGWEPTAADLRKFYAEVRLRKLPGYAFWNWRTLSRRPKLLAAVSEME
jgi:hypothetical protein